VYVGCALTDAPPAFQDNVEELKKKLSKICEVLKFKGLSDANLPHDVYFHDIVKCVSLCDLLLGICDFPSTGLGWEMAVQAEVKHGPVLAVAHQDAKVSKLILDPQLPGYKFYRYNNLCEDVYNLVEAKVGEMQLVCSG
jgi:hypothetical protein